MSGLAATGAVALGLLLLFLGAEWLVKGAAGLGRALGVRPLLIGVTVVAYGTSVPELVVSSAAALEGRSEIALGNVVGSNIANLGLILGLTALWRPVPVEGSLLRRELPVLVLASLGAPLLLIGGVGRLEGGFLLAGAVAFTALAARGLPDPSAEAEAVEADAELVGAPGGGGPGRLSLIALVGLCLLVGGGKLFVDGAAAGAAALGVSERVVGLTIVAVGTSAPELATSLVAAARGHASIALGNIVGSNVFNVLFVLGGASLIHPIEADVRAHAVDLVAMAGLTILAVSFMRTGRTVTRTEGAALLAGYIGFMAALVIA